jgi:nucleoside-diphosphate-sugar epimerase
MANYLVTGAAGFIGARVAALLLEQGHTVLGVDNLNDAYDVRMKAHRLDGLRDRDGFSFVKADIRAREDVAALKSGGPFDGVLNLAARAGVRASLENPWLYYDTNVTGTLNLLEFARTQEVPKFVLASTSSIYGEGAPLPTPEDADTSCPIQPYAASKKAAEVLGYSYHALYGLDVTVFRYFTVYGPAGRPDMVMFRFIQWIAEGRAVRINGDGEQTRGFTYVDDIARGTLQGLDPVGYEVFNLGGHENVKINQLLHMLESRLGKRAQVVFHPQHPADVSANWADVGKADAQLNWVPQVSFEQGVDRTVAWYQAEREWASRIDTGE